MNPHDASWHKNKDEAIFLIDWADEPCGEDGDSQERVLASDARRRRYQSGEIIGWIERTFIMYTLRP